MRITLLFAVLLSSTACMAQSPTAQSNWIASWGAAQQIAEMQNALPVEDMRDTTLRQTVHLSAGGSALRIHISNAFGTAPLHVTALHIAQPAAPPKASILPSTDLAVTFGGHGDVIIPAGAEYISDPVAFHVAALSDLAVSMHVDALPAVQTSHPGSRATSYIAHGDQVSAADLPTAKTVEHWFFLSELDVTSSQQGAAIVAFGDSITDGHGSTENGNDRWPDVLAKRLQASALMHDISVVNAGIGGNRVLLDGLGPNALSRFNRDVIARSGVRYVVVLEGVNDLGTLTRDGEKPPIDHALLVDRMISAYRQLILQAHSHCITIVGATITPDGGSDYYHPGRDSEADRQAINNWIHTPGHFDAVIDFDKVLRDPDHPDRLSASFDSGDHLHPSPTGYKAMAESVPLALFSSVAACRLHD